MGSGQIITDRMRPWFPVVGIGASAGGLAAFEAFFSGMPPLKNPGMAFVLVQHLAPDHKSYLCEIVKRCTRMEVFEVTDGMKVRLDCVYIIPPDHDMALLNGVLHLLKPGAPRGRRLPIDFFFRSLAQDQGERAVGVVLSGTGGDGTEGVRAIKAAGGVVIAQSAESAEFDDMPRGAIGTGLVDFQLPPAEIPSRLISYAAQAIALHAGEAMPEPGTTNALEKIFILLRSQTGHDFSLYKHSTINRRIDRRMAVHQIRRLDSYAAFLGNHPDEVDALFRDLLIGVTGFFRDPEAFAELEAEAIPKLFENKAPGETVRVWTPGCSTGEEAYSVAMLLSEHMQALGQKYSAQIFATDIDNRAIAAARAGIYPESIAGNISPERLSRFFTAEAEGGAYRVKKSLRDLLIFSEQDAIKDPPFSKIDLITCRNLLIYLGPHLQKKLIAIFHYALNPGGMLFLGNSESPGGREDLFTPVDSKSKIYRRREDAVPRPVMEIIAPIFDSAREFFPSIPAKAPSAVQPLRELMERELLVHAALVGAIVNEQGEILYLHGRSGRFLELDPGGAGPNNILGMAREGLARGLQTALRKACATGKPVEVRDLRIKTNDHFTTASLTVRPVACAPASAPALYLIVLQDTPALLAPGLVKAGRNSGRPSGKAGRMTELEEDLLAKEEYLQSTLEELRASTEELKSSNEEMQSINEELQSSNEELKTAKEELQSVNEELSTVNAELQSKVANLSQANNDMNNLLAGTGIGTVFADHHLRIMRFTPAVNSIINLILSDVGRPLGDIVSNLIGYDRLVEDTQSVLDTLVSKEVEVQSRDGKFYHLRIQPYRTLENVIEGAVISFLDITEMVRVREELRKVEKLQLSGRRQPSNTI